MVLEAGPKKVVAVLQSGESITVTGEGLRPVTSGLAANADAKRQIRRGAVVRALKTPKGDWTLTQQPEVEGAFVSIEPGSGAIRARWVGGFDFGKNKFNHVTQAWRQPGSSFKPFIYSSALEKGFTPATIVNDAPLFFDAGSTGSQPWEPKNYDGTFDGPMPLRRALAKSKRHGLDPGAAVGRRQRGARLGHPLWLRPRQARALSDDGAGAPARSRRCRWPRPTASSRMVATASTRC